MSLFNLVPYPSKNFRGYAFFAERKELVLLEANVFREEFAEFAESVLQSL